MAQTQFIWNPQSSKALYYLQNALMNRANKLSFENVSLYLKHPGLSSIRGVVLSCLHINLQNFFSYELQWKARIFSRPSFDE